MNKLHGGQWCRNKNALRKQLPMFSCCRRVLRPTPVCLIHYFIGVKRRRRPLFHFVTFRGGSVIYGFLAQLCDVRGTKERCCCRAVKPLYGGKYPAGNTCLPVYFEVCLYMIAGRKCALFKYLDRSRQEPERIMLSIQKLRAREGTAMHASITTNED